MMDDYRDIRSSDARIQELLDKAYGTDDLDESIGYFRTASDLGCTQATVHLGMLLLDGKGDRVGAAAMFEKAHDAGDVSGTRNLGYCYAVGIGVDKDKTRGAELYIQAANRGSAKAQCNIGVMCEHGNGVPQDYEEAARWFRMSAENGYSRGMTNYAVLLRDGKGVGKDLKKAAEWFERSGSPRAKRCLALMLLEGNGIPKDADRALSLLEDASATDSKSMVILGDLIFDDERERSVELYNKAASKGNQVAIERLEKMGLPVPEIIRRRKK